MQLLKQSTVDTVYVGPVLDSAGAAVTTAVLGDFRLVKNGTAATLTGATVTHDVNGYYTIALTTTNTNTLGQVSIGVGNTVMSMSTHRYSVIPPSVYDAIITNATNATGGLPTATGAISAFAGAIATTTNITAATGITLAAVTHTGATIPTVTTTGTTTNLTNLPAITANWLTAAGIATDAIGSAQIAASAVAEIQAGLATTGSAMTLTSGERTAIADATLGRSVATVESTAAEWSLASMILAAFESSVTGTTWTIKRTDGTTVHLTKTVVTNAAADPITGVS